MLHFTIVLVAAVNVRDLYKCLIQQSPNKVKKMTDDGRLFVSLFCERVYVVAFAIEGYKRERRRDQD